MKKIWGKLQRIWYFRIANPVVRKGESGGFKWVFRRFWLEISTVSGNFCARFTAAEHPYGYLLAGKDDSNIEGFCQMLYVLGMSLTTDQQFVDDVQKAFSAYEKRVSGGSGPVEDAEEEKMALEEVKSVQEYVELPKKERRKRDREVNGRLKKAAKDLEKSE